MPPTDADIERHLRAVYGLLPKGLIWTRRVGVREKVLRGLMGREGATLDDRARDLLLESDPRTATEMIGDWEVALGLPDFNSIDPAAQPTLDQRRAAAAEKYAAVGGASLQAMIDAAAALGFSISVIEYATFAPFRMRRRLRSRLWGKEWQFFWRVIAPPQAAASTLEATLRALKPAWTAVGFTYDNKVSAALTLAPATLVATGTVV